MLPSSIWEPIPKQAIALSCPAYEVMYGGAAGGGKSDWLLVDWLAQLEVANAEWRRTGRPSRGRTILLRKEYGRLQDLMNRAQYLFPLVDKDADWKAGDHMWIFPCGYRFEFGHMEGPDAHLKYHGQEFSGLYIDQVEEISEDQYKFLKLRVRTSDQVLRPLLRIRLTANPLGRYADWVKKRFVLPAREGFKFITETVETSQGKISRDRVFIPATLRDNRHIGAEYEAELLTAPEHYRRAFLDGDWDVTVGSFFGDVMDNRIHVIEPFEIPRSMEVIRGGDWGTRAPACCLWGAIDHDENIIIVNELYCPGESGRIFGKKILEIEEAWGWTDSAGRSKLHGYLDYQARQGHGSEGPTPMEAMMDMGISWFDADKRRNEGWSEIRRRLMDRSGPQKRTPGLRIFSHCKNLIRTLPNLVAKDTDPDDIAAQQEDHAADALRYLVMSRPMPMQDDKGKGEFERWEKIMLAQQAKATDRNGWTGY